ISSWAAAAFPRHASAEQNDELVLVRFCRRWGFLLAACAFVFSLSATWSGVVRQGDADFASIGGLIPFSDAADYLAGAPDAAKKGGWNPAMARRPLAAGFRTALLFLGGFSTAHMLLIQALLI